MLKVAEESLDRPIKRGLQNVVRTLAETKWIFRCVEWLNCDHQIGGL